MNNAFDGLIRILDTDKEKKQLENMLVETN